MWFSITKQKNLPWLFGIILPIFFLNGNGVNYFKINLVESSFIFNTKTRFYISYVFFISINWLPGVAPDYWAYARVKRDSVGLSFFTIPPLIIIIFGLRQKVKQFEILWGKRMFGKTVQICNY